MTWISIPVDDGTTMSAWLERPAQPAPAVLVLQELNGVNAYLRDVTRRIAELGYIALAPDLFHRTAERFDGAYDDLAPAMAHARAMTPVTVAADLRAAHAWLGVDRVAAWGFCMGGRIAHRANMVLPLRAAIAFYGSWPTDAADIAALRAPVLLAWGGSDPHLGAAPRRGFVDSLAAAGKSYIDVVFGDASHGFCCDAHPPSYHAPSARAAWALATTFLAEHL
jgi:carboxymethylenebutenolidase